LAELLLRNGVAEPILEARRTEARVSARGEALIVNLYAVVERTDVRIYADDESFKNRKECEDVTLTDVLCYNQSQIRTFFEFANAILEELEKRERKKQ
jgi:hypothetical protein